MKTWQFPWRELREVLRGKRIAWDAISWEVSFLYLNLDSHPGFSLFFSSCIHFYLSFSLLILLPSRLFVVFSRHSFNVLFLPLTYTSCLSMCLFSYTSGCLSLSFNVRWNEIASHLLSPLSFDSLLLNFASQPLLLIPILLQSFSPFLAWKLVFEGKEGKKNGSHTTCNSSCFLERNLMMEKTLSFTKIHPDSLFFPLKLHDFWSVKCSSVGPSSFGRWVLLNFVFILLLFFLASGSSSSCHPSFFGKKCSPREEASESDL